MDSNPLCGIHPLFFILVAQLTNYHWFCNYHNFGLTVILIFNFSTENYLYLINIIIVNNLLKRRTEIMRQKINFN